MNTIETFAMQSPPSDVLEWLISDDVFSDGKVTELARFKGVSGDIYQYDRLKALLGNQLFKARFEGQWLFETDPKWKDRSARIAIRETSLHSIAHFREDVQLELLKKRQGQFPGLGEEQLEIMDKQLGFLYDYYHSVLKGVV